MAHKVREGPEVEAKNRKSGKGVGSAAPAGGDES
jgi:hypothetical protein